MNTPFDTRIHGAVPRPSSWPGGPPPLVHRHAHVHPEDRRRLDTHQARASNYYRPRQPWNPTTSGCATERCSQRRSVCIPDSSLPPAPTPDMATPGAPATPTEPSSPSTCPAQPSSKRQWTHPCPTPAPATTPAGWPEHAAAPAPASPWVVNTTFGEVASLRAAAFTGVIVHRPIPAALIRSHLDDQLRRRQALADKGAQNLDARCLLCGANQTHHEAGCPVPTRDATAPGAGRGEPHRAGLGL